MGRLIVGVYQFISYRTTASEKMFSCQNTSPHHHNAFYGKLWGLSGAFFALE